MALEKSKTDVIEAYEKLLAGEDDAEDETGSDEDDNEEEMSDDDENSDDNTDEPKYLTRNRFAQQNGTKPRVPLSSISANVGIP